MGHRRLCILLFLTGFLARSTTHAAGQVQAAAITRQQLEQGMGSMMRSMVGSRPPSCSGRCWWCGGRRCEAVQVPVTHSQEELQQLVSKRRGHHHGGSSKSAAAAAIQGRGGGASHSPHPHHPSSYDDRSNYKPLSWRCMCGEVVVNP